MSNVTAPTFNLWYLLHWLLLDSEMKAGNLGETAKRNVRLVPYIAFEYASALICVLELIIFFHFGSALQIHILHSNRLGPYIIFEDAAILICILDLIFFTLEVFYYSILPHNNGK